MRGAGRGEDRAWAWARAGAAFTVAVACVALGGGSARAEDPPDASKTWASCVEHVPPGATRPKVVESFPAHGTSGWAAPLEITIEHGRGETVLPEGFRVQRGGDAAKAIESAGFRVPDAAGGSGPTIVTEHGETTSTTKLRIPFLALPKMPGRSALVLPPVPIAIARASGEVMTICTKPHPILVEDPIANEADPRPRPNPPPRPQREEWVLAKQVTLGALGGALVALAAGWLWRRYARRPKPVPAPPPKLPWVEAFDELEALRRSSLLAEARTGEYFDRVSDCIRKYLGARYGFDGLETTTDEMRALLRRVRPHVPELGLIGQFLAECDLVKFARVVPGEQECLDALLRGEEIVRRTMPPPEARPTAPPPARPPASMREAAP